MFLCIVSVFYFLVGLVVCIECEFLMIMIRVIIFWKDKEYFYLWLKSCFCK